MRLPLPAFLAAVLIALSSAPPALADLEPGDHTFTLKHDGRERSYIVHVPRDQLVNPWPVVLNFHGGGSSGAGQQAYTRMDETADHEGFLVVYPNGTGRLRNRLLTWNAGSCCGYAMDRKVDDVGFVRALLDDLDRRVAIDRIRIYATGLSNGAMMAYRLAAEAPDVVAAIAPVAGASPLGPGASKSAIPILHIHSVDDTRALYRGGLGPPYPLTRIRVQHPPVEELLASWARHDQCPGEPQVDPTMRGRGASAGHTATRVRYEPCQHGTVVVLWKLTGAGHVWPGGATEYLDKVLGAQSKVLGPSTDVIDANARIWAFFSSYHANYAYSMPE